MARPSLTPTQLAEKEARLAEIAAQKRHYNKKPGPELHTPAPVVETVAEPVVPNTEGGSIPAKKPFSPFAGSRIQRDYSTPKIDPSLANVVIAEAPTASANSSQAEMFRQPAATPNPAVSPSQNAAQRISKDMGTTDLKPLEKRESAERAVEGAFAFYEQLHTWGRMAMKVGDKKLLEKHNEGKLDITAPFISAANDPMGRGQNVREFFLDIDDQIDQHIVVTKDFKDQAREPAIRVAQKMGVGLTDEGFLIGLVGMDLLNKGTIVYQMRNLINDNFKALEKNYQAMQLNIEQEVQVRLQRERAALARQAAEATQVNTPPVATVVQEPIKPKEELPLTETTEVVQGERGINLKITPAGPEGGSLD